MYILWLVHFVSIRGEKTSNFGNFSQVGDCLGVFVLLWSKTSDDVTFSQEKLALNYPDKRFQKGENGQIKNGAGRFNEVNFYKNHLNFCFPFFSLLESLIEDNSMLTFLGKMWRHQQIWITRLGRVWCSDVCDFIVTSFLLESWN